MRNICVVTGTRAEYGLLYWTMRRICDDTELRLQLVVTGTHLSPEFGLTYKEIQADGFSIDWRVEMLLSSDTSTGISKSTGLGLIGFAEAFEKLKPDIVLVLGDRFEILAAAIAATMARIPLAHCHGGEATEGAIDESIRHSITKMAHLHFTATEAYRKRVIQLGEQPESVYNVGALGIENVNRLKLMDKGELEASLGFSFDVTTFLVTYHPVTLEENTAEAQFANLLQALTHFPAAKIIFTKPNADAGGRVISNLIDQYVAANPSRAIAFTSMGQRRYLSTLQFISVVIGNSSSGLIEVPSFKKPTVNIGERQRGRVFGDSVIHCEPSQNAIEDAIAKALSQPFQATLSSVRNPYGESNASEVIVRRLKDVTLDGILKKRFYNITQE